MGEYQHDEFRAVDRPLTDGQMRQLRAISNLAVRTAGALRERRTASITRAPVCRGCGAEALAAARHEADRPREAQSRARRARQQQAARERYLAGLASGYHRPGSESTRSSPRGALATTTLP